MGNYKELKGKASAKYKVKGGSARKAYAVGGRVSGKGNGTTVNIIVPPSTPPAPLPPPPGPPGGMMPPGPPPSPGAAGVKAMGGMPPGFKKGGRVKAGAASGEGRLQNAAAQKAR